MTQEEKIKRYDEALERAKKLQKTCDSTAVVGWCEYIFPELKESEDEKIRKGIIDFIKHESEIYGIKTWCGGYTTKEIIAWLEKQGHMLDADKVIEWLKANVYDDSAYGKEMIEKFKKDFEL